MEVQVELHGVLRPGSAERAGGGFRLDFGSDASTRDVVRALAERCGDPFRDALGSRDLRLPRHIRMFVDGEMLVTLDQPLRPKNGSAEVTVVVLSPMMGG